MNLQHATPSAFAGQPPLPTGAAVDLTERVVLHHLRSTADIGGILHLRDGIDLSAHAAAGRSFVELKKKRRNRSSLRV